MNKERVVFYRCPICGNIVQVINSSGVIPYCCGNQMQKLEPNVTDGNVEKHVPWVKIEGTKCTVEIGSSPHPMEKDHWIMWVYLETESGGMMHKLCPGEKPCVEFCIKDQVPVAAWCWCNKHGLWLKELK